jgi:hypothetical protein
LSGGSKEAESGVTLGEVADLRRGPAVVLIRRIGKRAGAMALGLVLPFALNVRIARAQEPLSWFDEVAGQLTFRTVGGEDVTCPYHGSSSLTLYPDQEDLRAVATTEVPSQDPRCGATVLLILSYRDKNGDVLIPTAEGQQRVVWTSTGVGIGSHNFRAHHSITFQACDTTINQICNFGTRPTEPK